MIIDFITKYYIVFVIITAFLALALIGYLMDMKFNSKNEEKISKKDIKNLGSVTFENLDVDKNVSLSELINNNRTNQPANQPPEPSSNLEKPQ